MWNTYFPIQLYFEDKLVDKIEPQQFQKLENYSKKKGIVILLILIIVWNYGIIVLVQK